jgi:translation elongation factor EF-1alpha
MGIKDLIVVLNKVDKIDLVAVDLKRRLEILRREVEVLTKSLRFNP